MSEQLPSASGGGRRKRSGRKKRPRNRRQGGGGGSGGSGSVLQSQQTKLTLRNIEGLESSKDILNMIEAFLTRLNQQQEGGKTVLPVVLDQGSVERIIQIEEAAEMEKAKQEAQAQNEGAKGEGAEGREKGDGGGYADTVVINGEDGVQGEAGEEKGPSPTNGQKEQPKQQQQQQEQEQPQQPQQQQQQQTMADIVKESEKPMVEGPYIAARALYAIPSKKSRRRGELNGCAYLLLTAPPPKLPEKPTPASTEKKTETSLKVEDSVDTPEETPTAEDAAEKNGAEGAATAEAEKQNSDTKADAKSPSKPNSNSPVLTPAEKSRLTAIGRLQLIHAVEAMERLADEDSKGKQNFHRVVIETSSSQKSWKDKDLHRDRREGTIFNTGDFKQFFANQNKLEEDRNNRPKPLPGGGVASIGEDGNNGEKLSAIVLHLRSKHEEQSRRKKAKKKSQKDAKKAGKTGSSSGGGSEKKQDGGKNTNSSKSSKSRRNRGRSGGGGGGGGGGVGGAGGGNRDGGKKKNIMAPVILAKPPGR